MKEMRFNWHDFRTIERVPNSPSYLQSKISDLVYSSVYARCKIDSFNPETGEYRVILHGTLDREEPDIGWMNR